MEPLQATGYFAAEDFLGQLKAELRDVTQIYDRLVLASGPPQATVWHQNLWLDPVQIRFSSIKDAAAQLKAIQRNWWPYATSLHRRTELIKAELPHVGAKPLAFPAAVKTAPLGAFMLLESNLMIAAARTSSPFPQGEVHFEEFTFGPPSRAYLKLWEALTVLGVRPAPGEQCLDLGASPGGWTWVLAGLGAKVKAFDRAELDPRIVAMPGVSFQKGDAFAARPEREGKVDWLFSDVICYPEKLLEYVKLWLDSGLCRNFVCTIKFQGQDHYSVIDEFARIPGARVMHLFHNKHELTFALIGK